MKLYYEVIVEDRHGRVIAHHKGEAKSWLRQWSHLVYGGMSGSAQSVTDTGGVARTQSVTYDLLGVASSAGDASRGVVVGGGVAVVDIEDYRLDAQIVHGAGAGQLDHQPTTIIYPAVSGLECRFQIKRIFINTSGGTVTVREIGIYGAITSAYKACIARDVLVGAVVVPDGGAITVIYSVKAVA